jgi:AcrR family transcriptional regulator
MADKRAVYAARAERRSPRAPHARAPLPGVTLASSLLAGELGHLYPDRGILLRSGQPIAVLGGDSDEMRHVVGGRWLERAGDRTPDLLEEPPEPRGGDDEVHRRLAGDIAVGVRCASRHAHVVSGVGVVPFQALRTSRQHLLRAGQDEEIFRVVMAVRGAQLNRVQAGPPGPSSRPYQSVRRAQAAADTHATILAPALRLFLEHGYGKVTVSDIAREAAIAVPTVYASTGGKSAILATLIDEAMRDPVVDETLAAVRQCRTPREVIALTAHGIRADNERYYDVIQVMKTAAAIDETATGILVRSDRGYRQALAHAARRLGDMRALRPAMTLARATDILWFYFGHQAWHLLVSDRQWSWDEAEQWLGEQASTALLDPEFPDPS